MKVQQEDLVFLQDRQGSRVQINSCKDTKFKARYYKLQKRKEIEEGKRKEEVQKKKRENVEDKLH